MPNPLACFDLDNTLIDRDAAFRGWATAFAAGHSLDDGAVDWFLGMDLGGYRPRPELFAAARDRFGLAEEVPALVAAYNVEHPQFTWCEPEVLDGLARLRAAGWRVAVVTNGGTIQQTAKLALTGVGDAVDYCCISETEGVSKPDRQIFEIAAQRTGAVLDGGWMAGDHLAYDIAGGQAAGLNTILVGPSSSDPASSAAPAVPDAAVTTVLEAFDLILAG
jgi:FMN phosphatase YigB (HAD superfamily)